MPDFAHLHVHTEYSLLDGLAKIRDLVRQAKALGMRHLAITDHGNMHGVLEFFLVCREEGIHPVLGVEAYVCDDITRKSGKNNDYNHLVLLAKDQQGYYNLMNLTTEAHTKGLYYGKPRVDKSILAKYASGIIATTSCLSGEIPELLRNDDMDGARRAVRWFQDLYGPENFLVEYEEHYGKGSDQTRVNKLLYELQRELHLSAIVTNDSHYIVRGESPLHNLFLRMQTADRYKGFDSDQYYLKSPQEMYDLFPHNPEWFRNTVAVAEMCQIDPTLWKGGLPEFTVPSGFASEADYLYHLCAEGAKERYGLISERVREQLDYEFHMIEQKGFVSYFLIEWDFVNYARSRGIRCLARGSAAGSILAYSLGITNVDPLRYQLPFERFFNIERADMPDIDMDFPDDRREEVINYVMDKYGAERVAQMVTFNRLGAKQAVRDVARVEGWQQLADQIAKLLEKVDSIEEGLETSAQLKKMYDSDQRARTLLDSARSLEGFTRNTGVHAAGLVISQKPLNEIVPLSLRDPKRPEAGRVIQYEQKYYEKHLGLIKYDFLGLSCLSTIDTAIKFIKATRGEDVVLEKIPLDRVDDETGNAKREKAFDLLRAGNTKSVFQLDGDEMTGFLRQLQPSSIEDIMAMIALYRPGPMDSIPDFISAKHGKKRVEYLDPRLSEWLKESYGVIVFQDQVLFVCVGLANFTWGKANKFRKALSKKIMSEVESYRGDFVEGCVANGVDRGAAEKLFKLIQPFGGYGFNKAHAASYAVVAYYTAYLKANYTAEYMAAAMTTEVNDSGKLAALVAECKKLGVRVLPPDVNHSECGFCVEHASVRFGLHAIKGIGDGPAREIVSTRGGGKPYSSLGDLCIRLEKNATKGVLDLLIKAGALDSLGERHLLLASIDQAIKWGKMQRAATMKGIVGLFDTVDGGDPALSFSLASHAPRISRKQLLAWEKDLLGVYLSGHPVEEYAAALASQVKHTTAMITSNRIGERLEVGGVVTSVRNISTKRDGSSMCSITLEDAQGTASVTVFPALYRKVESFLVEGAVVLVHGRVETYKDKLQVSAESIDPFQRKEPRLRKPCRVWLKIYTSDGRPRDPRSVSDEVVLVAKLYKLLQPSLGTEESPASDQYNIIVESPVWRVHLDPAQKKFRYTDVLHQQLVDLLGPDGVEVAVIDQEPLAG